MHGHGAGLPNLEYPVLAHVLERREAFALGVPLSTVLDAAALELSAVSVLARGFDHGTPGEFATGSARYVPEDIQFEKALPLEKALHPDTLLA